MNMHAKPGLREEQAAGGRDALSANAGRQLTAGKQQNAELVTWREEVEIKAETTTVPARFKVRTYVTEERVSKQVPVKYQEATISKERISPEEAARLTPRAIREMTQDFEIQLQMVEAVVSKKLVPAERIRIDLETKQEMVDVEETVKTEHIKIEEPPKGKREVKVRREGYTNLRK
jgi:stress response protein YsnF